MTITFLYMLFIKALIALVLVALTLAVPAFIKALGLHATGLIR